MEWSHEPEKSTSAEPCTPKQSADTSLLCAPFTSHSRRGLPLPLNSHVAMSWSLLHVASTPLCASDHTTTIGAPLCGCTCASCSTVSGLAVVPVYVPLAASGQMRSVKSCATDATYSPSGEHARQFTLPACPGMFTASSKRFGAPSAIGIALIAKSLPPATTRLASGVAESENMPAPQSTLPISPPFAVLKRYRWKSVDTVASHASSLHSRTAVTGPECPTTSCVLSGLLVSSMDHTRTSFSRAVVAITGRAGLSCTAYTPEVCASSVCRSASPTATFSSASIVGWALRILSMSDSLVERFVSIGASSQNLMVPSIDPVIRSLVPFIGWTKRTSALCPVSVRTFVPLTSSHIFTVLSRAPEKSTSSPCAKPMLVTSPRWPSRLNLRLMRMEESSARFPRMLRWSVETSHTLIDESRPVDASRLAPSE
mmetsp:Transcript_21423/g.55152  ORF Transcript_21423/g.55152 Transcript_21423/m.55152 type:complete len:427 (-) Transcript_21423:651-1931(-)